MTSESTSVSMLEGMRSGNRDAWSRFVRVYGPVVYAKCRRSGFSSTDSEDIAQDVFVRIQKGIGSFERDGRGKRFRYWLHPIVRTAIADFVRHNKRTPKAIGGSTFQEVVAHVQANVAPEESFSSHDADAVLIVRQALKLIEGAFEPKSWQAFWRTAIEGASGPVVAQELGMQPNAVRQAKLRVMRRLATELKDMLD